MGKFITEMEIEIRKRRSLLKSGKVEPTFYESWWFDSGKEEQRLNGKRRKQQIREEMECTDGHCQSMGGLGNLASGSTKREQ